LPHKELLGSTEFENQEKSAMKGKSNQEKREVGRGSEPNLRRWKPGGVGRTERIKVTQRTGEVVR